MSVYKCIQGKVIE